MMRQTNIVWVIMVFGKYVSLHAIKNALKKKQKKKNCLRISEEVKETQTA